MIVQLKKIKQDNIKNQFIYRNLVYGIVYCIFTYENREE